MAPLYWLPLLPACSITLLALATYQTYGKWESGFVLGDSTIKQHVNIQHLAADSEAVENNKKDVRYYYKMTSWICTWEFNH